MSRIKSPYLGKRLDGKMFFAKGTTGSIFWGFDRKSPLNFGRGYTTEANSFSLEDRGKEKDRYLLPFKFLQGVK